VLEELGRFAESLVTATNSGADGDVR
jgi:hypothetical protein